MSALRENQVLTLSGHFLVGDIGSEARMKHMWRLGAGKVLPDRHAIVIEQIHNFSHVS